MISKGNAFDHNAVATADQKPQWTDRGADLVFSVILTLRTFIAVLTTSFASQALGHPPILPSSSRSALGVVIEAELVKISSYRRRVLVDHRLRTRIKIYKSAGAREQRSE